jgi:hypothetical protein
MKRMGKWLKPRLYLRMVEHGLLGLLMVLMPFYMQEKPMIWIPGWFLLIPPVLSGIINLFLVKYDQTPCNATFQLTIKTVLVLRLVVGANIILKHEAQLDWEWATAFWPYWCSFTIQAVLIIATVVIFLNTISLFFRSEARMHDGKLGLVLSFLFVIVLGSLWGFLMAAGFMLSTLQPVIVIIKIFDVARGIPDIFFIEDYSDKDELAYEKQWLTESEEYALDMLINKKHEIPYRISLYPLIYCFGGVLITLLLKKQIALWFEVILYSEEE